MHLFQLIWYAFQLISIISTCVQTWQCWHMIWTINLSMYLNSFQSSSKSCILTVFQSISTFFNNFDIFIHYHCISSRRNPLSMRTRRYPRPARPGHRSPASHHRPSHGVCRPPTLSRELANERRPPAIRSNATSIPGTGPARRQPLWWRAPGD